MEDDEFSDSDINFSFIESTSGPTVSFKGKLPEDRKLYKKDKKCVFCAQTFGIGILNAKKHFCKFCYRGICAKCSPKVAFHPEDRRNLRICNFCCEDSVKESFAEGFQIRAAEIQQQIQSYKKESAQVFNEIQLILKDIYKFENLIRLEQENWKEILDKHKNLPELTKEKSLLNSKFQNFMLKYEDIKKFFSIQDSKISKLGLAVQIERKNSLSQKQTLAELKTHLSEIQDARLHLHTRGYKRSSSVVLSEPEKKEESEFNAQVIRNFELESQNLRLQMEIEKIENQNQELAIRLRSLKEEINPDRLVTNDRNKFDIEEEEKIRILRNKQKIQQATIEKLKLELRLGNSKNRKDRELRGEDEEEEVNLKETTRPCARCQVF